MKIGAINSGFYMPRRQSVVRNIPFLGLSDIEKANITESNPRLGEHEAAEVSPAFFIDIKGHAKEIRKASLLTSNGPVKIYPNQDGSYTLNSETETKAYYGKAAYDFLSSHEEFENETQIVFPNGSSGVIYKDGKEIPVSENYALLITKGTKLKVVPDKKSNSPYIVTTEKDFDWYKRYDKNSIKYDEALYYGSHAYNGEFSPNFLLSNDLKDHKLLDKLGIEIPDVDTWNNLLYLLDEKKDLLDEDKRNEVIFVKGIFDKLWKKNMLEKTYGGHIRFKFCSKDDVKTEELKCAGLNEDEIDKIMPIASQARNVRIHTKPAIKSEASLYGKELVDKMKKEGIIYNNKKYSDKIFWKKNYGNEWELQTSLREKGFSKDEIDKVIEGWKKENFAMFDLSGLKYLDDDISIYSLNDKINNWTQLKTNWVTDSICASSSQGKPPMTGTSLVQYNKKGFVHMAEVRIGEALHKHPNNENAKQYEIYLITEGKCALRVVNNEKEAKRELMGEKRNEEDDLMILKAGDLVILEPGIHHCVHSIMGNYEHICTQVPSVFHYGESYKMHVPDKSKPEDVTSAAKDMLNKEDEPSLSE